MLIILLKIKWSLIVNYYWVNVGKSFKEVLQDGFLWAPIPYVNENDRKISNAGWKHVPNMKKGDLAFCVKDKTILYVAVVKEDSYPDSRPKSRKFNAWKKHGIRVEVDVFELSDKLITDTFVNEFYEKFNNKCDPKVFNEKLGGCEQYAALMSNDAGEFVLNLIDEHKQTVIDTGHVLIEKDVRNYTFPYQSIGETWALLSSDVAVKRVDKTLRDQRWTCIPQDIVSFFIGAPLKLDEETTIKLIVDGKEYEVIVKRRPDGRHKIVLTKTNVKLQVQKLTVEADTVWFERDTDERNQFYVYTKSKNKSVSVRPKPKRKPKKKPSNTSRKTSGESRVGQDYFKSEVSEVCNERCIVTGVKDQVPSILIGSHIKSWADSDDDERMDGENGLLLAPHVDKLFDRYLITFSDNGKILVSNQLNESVLEQWGIDLKKPNRITKKQNEYMAFHRKKFTEKQS